MKKYYFTRCIVIVLSLLFLGGCRMIPGFGKKKISREDELLRLETAMDDHLEKKYGPIVYRQKAFEGGGFDHPEDRWYLEADLSYYWQKDLGKGKAEFIVERRDTEDGEVFKDEFFGLIVKKEFEGWIEELAKPYFSNIKVNAHTDTIFYPNELTVESDLQDMLKYKDQLWCIDFSVTVEEDGRTEQEFQERAQDFVKEWEKQGVFSWPNIVYMTKEGYEKYDPSRLEETFFHEECIVSFDRIVGEKPE